LESHSMAADLFFQALETLPFPSIEEPIHYR